MKAIVKLDDDNYVRVLMTSDSEEAIEVPDEVFNSGCVTCYKYENEIFTLDEDKKKKIDNSAEVARLKAELATYDYIGTKIAMGVATKEDYAEQIAYTEELREKIRALENN